MNAVVDTKSSEPDPDPDPAPLPMDASSALSNDAPIDPPQSEEVVVAASDQPSAEAPPVVTPASDEPLPKFDARGA